MKKVRGFTLIEMMLVLVIASAILYLAIGYVQQRTLTTRVDRTAQQMQQVLTAGLSYYVSNGKWPANLGCLKGAGGGDCTNKFLPDSLNNSPWATPYGIVTTTSNLYVYTQVVTSTPEMSTTYAKLVLGRLPLGYIASDTAAPPNAAATCSGATCYIVSSVNIPGQNLNNASAINFAGQYHHGACVPVPECPVDKDGNTMNPEIIVVPTSVAGVADQTDPNGMYAISRFEASAVGGTNTSPPYCQDQTNTTPSGQNCATPIDGQPAAKYWRVCLHIDTLRGSVNSRTDFWGQDVYLAAFTRCSINNEPAGSTINVFGN